MNPQKDEEEEEKTPGWEKRRFRGAWSPQVGANTNAAAAFQFLPAPVQEAKPNPKPLPKPKPKPVVHVQMDVERVEVTRTSMESTQQLISVASMEVSQQQRLLEQCRMEVIRSEVSVASMEVVHVQVQRQSLMSPDDWLALDSVGTRAPRVDVDTTERIDVTPKVMMFANSGNLDGLQKLCRQKPALVNFVENTAGYTPLLLACARREADIVQYLLEQKADANASTTHTKDTPLHKAFLIRDAGIVQQLLDAGASINARNARELPACGPAFRDRHSEEMAQLAVQKGADLTAFHALVEALDFGACLPVQQYLTKQYEAAALGLHMARDGVSPLSMACKWGIGPIVRQIVESGGDGLVNQKDTTGWTPLVYACRWGHALADDPKPQLGDDDRNRKTAICRFLLSHGADANQVTAEGQCALFLATRYGPKQLLETLCSVADLKQVTSAGSVLHIAAQFAPAVVTSMLFERIGTDAARDLLNHRDDNGETATEIAARLNDAELLKIHGQLTGGAAPQSPSVQRQEPSASKKKGLFSKLRGKKKK